MEEAAEAPTDTKPSKIAGTFPFMTAFQLKQANQSVRYHESTKTLDSTLARWAGRFHLLNLHSDLGLSIHRGGASKLSIHFT